MNFVLVYTKTRGEPRILCLEYNRSATLLCFARVCGSTQKIFSPLTAQIFFRQGNCGRGDMWGVTRWNSFWVPQKHVEQYKILYLDYNCIATLQCFRCLLKNSLQNFLDKEKWKEEGMCEVHSIQFFADIADNAMSYNTNIVMNPCGFSPCIPLR